MFRANNFDICITINIFRYSINQHFKSIALAKYKSNDSCLFILEGCIDSTNYGWLKSSSSDDIKNINKVSCDIDKLYPIPNFIENEYATMKTKTRLPDDFEIYVLDAKAVNLKDSNYVTDGYLMPEKWKNGYSKGVAISNKRNVIIYWLNTW